MEELQEQLGYTFKNGALLQQALTHPSLAAETAGDGGDNQRLEFLGDAVLQLVLTDYFFRDLPTEPEGKLTQLRASVVSRKALSSCAFRINLGKFLRLGRGEDANGGRLRDSNLADAVEAIVGAIYLDSGLDAARVTIMKILGEDMHTARDTEVTHNPKGTLQEILQAIDQESPVYRVVEEEGPDHSKEFVTEVVWRDQVLGSGRGSSKKISEASAAMKALEKKLWVAGAES